MNIVIIEQNKIFRESLKTVLNQIPDFEVVFDADNNWYPEEMRNVVVNLILIDYSFGKTKCNEAMNKALLVWGTTVKFLFLTDYKEECANNNIKSSDIILKHSSKKEFENKIRKHQLH